jgi:hypothetical protein
MSNLYRSLLARRVTPAEEAAAAAHAAHYRADRWTQYAIRPLLIALLVGALLSGLLLVVEIASGDGSWQALLPLLFLVALEAIYTTLWLQHPDRMILDKPVYRLAELVFILVVLRVVSWLMAGADLPTLADLALYLRNPGAFFSYGRFLPIAFLALLTWGLSVLLSSIFAQLALSEFEIRYYTQPPVRRAAWADNQPIRISRGNLVGRFLVIWVYGGVLLLFFTALSTLALDELSMRFNLLALARLGLPPQMLVALLVYFLAGLWLLSQARLAVMNAHWLLNGVVKNASVERSWQRNSLLLLLLVALVASLLPIGSTLAISRILNLLIYYSMLLINLIATLFALLVFAVFSRLAREGAQEAPERSEPFDPAAFLEGMEQNEAAGGSETLTFIFSSAVWTLLIVAVVAAVIYFLRERGLIGGDNRQIKQNWRAFVAWLQQLWAALRWRVRDARLTWQERLRIAPAEEAPAESPTARPRFIRLNALSPREQVRYFYLAAVRRAGERGVPRRQSETPLEYVEDLKANWPEAEQEVEQLTDAFLKARYSPQPIEKEDVNPVKETWRQVKGYLRRRTQPPADGAPAEEDAAPGN